VVASAIEMEYRRVDKAMFALGNCTVRVYAKNHNILRVVDGFGGVLFTI
jgi:hypothetical protein